jgi:hypothetical protein
VFSSAGMMFGWSLVAAKKRSKRAELCSGPIYLTQERCKETRLPNASDYYVFVCKKKPSAQKDDRHSKSDDTDVEYFIGTRYYY